MKVCAKPLIIRSGAAFIADAHLLPSDVAECKAALKAASSAEQLIILGDFFAALFGGVKASESAYKSLITILESEPNNSQKIYYFEGNHDFCLRHIFKRVKVFDSLINPAIFCSSTFDSHIFKRYFPSSKADSRISFLPLRARGFIQHGDVFLPPLTAFALRLLRSKIFLAIANAMDVNAWIFRRILKAQEHKALYKKLPHFRQITESRIAALKSSQKHAGMIIEGHFHQGESYASKDYKYINLSAFANDKKIWRLGDDLQITSNLH